MSSVDQANFPWRPLGLLLVQKGLVNAFELERALEEQRKTGRLLGQILVRSGYVTSLALTQALAEQHGVELRSAEPSEKEPLPEAPDALPDLSGQDREWRPLGKILIDKGFLNEEELGQALAEQIESPGRRLGEILVARGWLSGAALALGLADQHGLELGPADKLDEELEAVIKPQTSAEPVYRVYEVEYEPTYRAGSVLYENANFLEAADFACDFVARRSPRALEIQKRDGAASEIVWTYSQDRAHAEAAERKNLVQTFGFDPMRWDTRGQFDTPTR
jgi:hypothetical protein